MSLVHYMRAHGTGELGLLADPEGNAVAGWVRTVLLLLVLDRAGEDQDIGDLLESIEEVRALGQLTPEATFTEPVLSQDWNRPEEDEAWADL